MPRLELLTLLYSLDALLDSDKIDTVKEVIKKIIAEAERS